MVSKPFLWLFALLVLAITGCGGSGGRSDSLIAVWPTSGVYAVSKAPLSDGTLLTLQVGISSTPGKGGIRFNESSRWAGNMKFRNARAINGAVVVSGQPDEHTYNGNAPEYTYTIQAIQSKLVVYLSRRGRVETVRLDRIGDHARRAARTTGIGVPTNSILNGGGLDAGRLMWLDTVSNIDYGDSYGKLLVFFDSFYLAVDFGSNDLATTGGGFVVPNYYIGDNNGTSANPDIGGYLIFANARSDGTWRIYLQPNEDSTISVVYTFSERGSLSGDLTTVWDGRPLTLSPNEASLRYPSAYSSAFIDVGSEVSIGYGLGANPSLVGFTIDDTSAISSLLSGYTGDQLAWAALSSSELPSVNPSNVWVSVLNSSALRTPNDISINLVGNVSLIRDAIVYGD